MKCVLCARPLLLAKRHITETSPPPKGALLHPCTWRAEPRPREALRVAQTVHGSVRTPSFPLHRPWLVTGVLCYPSQPISHRRSRHIPPSQRLPTWPILCRSEPSSALTRHHSWSGLLIETMCGAARQGQGGGNSGSQPWPRACGCWEAWGRKA